MRWQAEARCRRKGGKRVDNAKMKRDLGIQLMFPSYREGLKAIHEGNLSPFE